MIDLDNLPLRKLQIESSIALQVLQNADNLSLSSINQKVDHDSTIFYKQVLEVFIKEYGDIPTNTEVGKKVKLIYPQ
tara:strand:+ start:726 stop:956 length:231 start_codon:yes stop_codon:yes gene_type:complete